MALIWNRKGASRAAGFVAAAASALAALVVLLGYGMGMDRLVRVASTFPAIMPTTAVSFMFLAASVGSARSDFRASRQLAMAGVAAVVAIAVTNLALNAMGHQAGLDGMMGLSTRPGDMMAPGTAYGLILAAICVCASVRRGMCEDLALYGAMTGLTTAIGVLFMHSFDPNSPMSVPIFRSTSVMTALLFVLTFAAILLDLGLFVGQQDELAAEELEDSDFDDGRSGGGAAA